MRRSTDTLYYMKLAFVFLMRTSEAVHDRHIYPTMLWSKTILYVYLKGMLILNKKLHMQSKILHIGHMYYLAYMQSFN